MEHSSDHDEIINIIKSELTKYDKLAKILKLIVDKCEIDQTKYFILGSYAIRKYREINDLDINMDYREFLKLGKLGYGILEFYNNQIRWFLDMTDLYNKQTGQNVQDFSIEVFQKEPTVGFPNEKFSLQYLKDHQKLSIDDYGHQFFNYQTLLEWKQTMNRPKDQDDIILLQKIIEQTGGYQHKYYKYKRKYLNLKRRKLQF